MSACERFAIKKRAEKERADRRKVLEEPDRNQTEMPRRVTEPKERDGSDNAGAN